MRERQTLVGAFQDHARGDGNSFRGLEQEGAFVDAQNRHGRSTECVVKWNVHHRRKVVSRTQKPGVGLEDERDQHIRRDHPVKLIPLTLKDELSARPHPPCHVDLQLASLLLPLLLSVHTHHPVKLES
eukprot:CAMPEP_0173403040 /NCGR_PEP_ID=MMETSP1356-20130122/55652_1 /TAXON_ID=77927 ORGANISM="Hemiselmis virescens, Strain PCC157" /NCGR_SAMPLE_ID=MMETSP1356 /ASSEMBLY_ACC=CAM_ASM_000847 /LENGTH=127 /DNA_ID=CAMNT_0014363503 /DNA_START=40 /DNA_END=423 /DNA_ORIENTATION=+